MNKPKRKMRFLARIISMLLVLILMSEEFLGSGNIVLAAETESTSMTEDITGTGDAETDCWTNMLRIGQFSK